MDMPPAKQPQDKYILRLPDGLRERIKRAAAQGGRSMNAEIVRLLEQAYPEDEPLEDIVNGLKIGLAIVKRHGSRASLGYILEELTELASRLEEGGHFDGEDPAIPAEPRPKRFITRPSRNRKGVS